MREPINDVVIPAEAVVAQLGTELGLLSVILVQSRLQVTAALGEVNRLTIENEGLRTRVLARDADVVALREQVAPKRKR